MGWMGRLTSPPTPSCVEMSRAWGLPGPLPGWARGDQLGVCSSSYLLCPHLLACWVGVWLGAEVSLISLCPTGEGLRA